MAIVKKFRDEFLAPCGFSGVQDIRNGVKQDRMESFALSETLKYLYLLFDEANVLHHGFTTSGTNALFSTEGHVFWFDDVVKRYDLVSEFDGQDNKFGHDGDKDSGSDVRGGDATANNNNEPNTIGYFQRFFKDQTPKFNTRKAFNDFKQHYRSTHPHPKSATSISPSSHQPHHKSNRFHEMTNIDKLDLRVNPDYLHLTTCSVPTTPSSASTWLSSKMLQQNSKLYQLDENYQISLRRPPYLLDNLEMELKSDFYDVFCGSVGAASSGGGGGSSGVECVCEAIPDTHTLEAIVDDSDRVSDVMIYELEIDPEADLTPTNDLPATEQQKQQHSNAKHQTRLNKWYEKHKSNPQAIALPGDIYLRIFGPIQC
ncbi:unnamed protein product [Ambrosiozyma monospora]|uniref:Unnamed protein product n=1 Tax=Ambrosiozyma monospora TaxID=43982 RepID=A0ACB5TZ82_AMBMO|nr:unnamed protein product [Ambrosiozyma monospora]